jgi:5-methylcytosine-specific restriction endonuclease McrA
MKRRGLSSTPGERRAEVGRAVKRRQNRRRAERRRSNGPRQRFTLQQVGDRDGWMCAICCAAVSSVFQSPHPCSASVHHVVEVVQGGTDTLDNVVLAHRFCNSDSHTWGQRPPAEARARLADRVLYGKHGPGRRKRIPEPVAIALATEIMGVALSSGLLVGLIRQPGGLALDLELVVTVRQYQGRSGCAVYCHAV